MGGPKYPVQLKDAEREALQKIIAKSTEKCNIIFERRLLWLDKEMECGLIAEKLDILKDTVTNWTILWHEMSEKQVHERLQDLPRSGAPPSV